MEFNLTKFQIDQYSLIVNIEKEKTNTPLKLLVINKHVSQLLKLENIPLKHQFQVLDPYIEL